MEKLKVIICGCTKNSSKYIVNEINSLLKIKPLFARFDIVLYENDSTDNTVDILKQHSPQCHCTIPPHLFKNSMLVRWL